MEVLRAFAALLCYPDRELIEALPEARALIDAAAAVSDAERSGLGTLLSHLATRPLLDLQEDYVELFDRTRTLSLHLYEHVHGDARQRGQAMAQLLEVYQEAGFELATAELPDYLPVLLEFLSVLPDERRMALLADVAPLLALLAARLLRRESPYAALLSTLAAQGGVRGVASDPEEEEASPGDLEALDAAWAEAPVEFGLGASDTGGCTAGRGELLQIDSPAPGSRGLA